MKRNLKKLLLSLLIIFAVNCLLLIVGMPLDSMYPDSHIGEIVVRLMMVSWFIAFVFIIMFIVKTSFFSRELTEEEIAKQQFKQLPREQRKEIRNAQRRVQKQAYAWNKQQRKIAQQQARSQLKIAQEQRHIHLKQKKHYEKQQRELARAESQRKREIEEQRQKAEEAALQERVRQIQIEIANKRTWLDDLADSLQESQIPSCPICKSKDLEFIQETRGPASVGGAFVGQLVGGFPGAFAFGMMGAKRELHFVCNECGHVFTREV